MAKLNTPRGFDKAQIPGDLLPKLEPFIDYVNQNIDQVVRGINGQLTTQENMLGKVFSIDAKHNSPFKLDISQRSVTAVYPLKVSGGKLRSYGFSANTDGTLSMTFCFDDPIPVQTKNVTGSSSVYSFECKDPIRVGDTILTSGYANAAMNGEFTVIAINTSLPRTLTVYNTNSGAAAETKPSYSGDIELAKAIQLFIAY